MCSTQCPDVESQITWTIPTQQEPGKINVFFVNPEETTVWLDWNKPKTGGSEITLYEIQRRTQEMAGTYPYSMVWQSWSTIFSDLPTADIYNAYSHQDTGLYDNKMYQYKIRAVNAEGNAIFSDIQETMTSGTFETYATDYTFADDFDYDAAGTTYADDMDFDETRDFGAGQTFGDSTEFAYGQTFDDDVNFSGSDIQFSGSTFENEETFGSGADFHGTQSLYGRQTRLVIKQHLLENRTLAIDNTELWRRNIFRRNFRLCRRSRVWRRYSVCNWTRI